MGDALDPAIGKIYLNMFRTEKNLKVMMILKDPQSVKKMHNAVTAAWKVIESDEEIKARI